MEGLRSTQSYQKFLHGVSSQVAKGELTPEGAAKQLMEMQVKRKETGSVLSDVLQAVDVEVECWDDEDQKTRFKEFCKLCSEIVPGDVMHLSLDSHIDDSSSSKIIKAKTRLFYKQVKFNLLREESEGYSKIVTELSQDPTPDFTPRIALKHIRCLIGQFNLDPNRVLDLILECLECQESQHRFFVELLRVYGASKEDICNLLGFKFTFYQARFKSKGDVPESLYIMAALLIHYELIDLVALCTFLVPLSDWILDHHRKVMEEAGERAKKLQLSSTATLEHKDNDLGGIIPYELDERYSITENQKLGLTWALLEIGDWRMAKQLLDRFPEFYAVRSMEVAQTLIRLIDRKITHLYTTKCGEYCCLLGEKGKGQSVKDEGPLVSFSQEDKAVETWKDLVEVFPMLDCIGPGIAHGPIVMTRLLRLLAAYMKEGNLEDDTVYCKVVDVMDEVLLPALTILTQNCAASEEVWSVIEHFPYQTRYRLYGRWKSVHTGRHPLLVVKKGHILGRTRYVMKRLSKETTRMIGRQLGKLSHCQPAIVFDYMLNQIQTFENLIGPVVESLRYLSNLEFDVLAYCIIEHLSSPAKEKLKVSDATLSPWLQSLATFVGTVYKKYNMELTGVLQYVANQLKAGKSFDLLVLREIIQNMSGIETTSGLTTEQVEALAGGDLLRQEGGYFGQIRNIRRTTNRLKEALLQEDLVVGLCILMAQQRGSIVFKEGEGIHLKLVGQMLDQCQDTLVQFGSFLSTNLKAEDYAKRMPPAPQLIQEYHVPHDAALLLARPIYINAISSKYDDLKKQDRANKISLGGERKSQHYKTSVSEVLEPLWKSLGPLFPEGIWNDISPQLFTTFWTLTMYDLHVPKASYERESERLKKSIQQIEDNRDMSESKRRKEKERVSQTESKLMDEQRRQMDHVSRVMARLRNEKEQWFLAKAARSSAVNQFMQLCLLPRCVFTDLDALFCAKFINVVHSMKTLCFNTLICYDRIFNEISPSLAGLSENEASYFGRFLCAMMETMMRWHKDSPAFQRECAGYPGFITKFRNPINAPPSEDKDNTKDRVDFQNFRHVVHKWHFKLTKSLLASLGSGNYVMIRNALIIMIKILPYYPVLIQFHKVIESRVVKIRDEEKEKRQDLSVLAARVRKTPLMNEEDFHQKSAPKPKVAVAPKIPTKTVSNESTGKEEEGKGAAKEPVKPPPKTVRTTKPPILPPGKNPPADSSEKPAAPKPSKVHINRPSAEGPGKVVSATKVSSASSSVKVVSKESHNSTEMKPPADKKPLPGPAAPSGGESGKLEGESRKEQTGRKWETSGPAAAKSESPGKRVVRVEEKGAGVVVDPLLGKEKKLSQEAPGGGKRGSKLLEGKDLKKGPTSDASPRERAKAPESSSGRKRSSMNGEVQGSGSPGAKKIKEDKAKRTPDASATGTRKESNGHGAESTEQPKRRKVEEGKGKEKEEKKEKRTSSSSSRSTSKESPDKRRSSSREVSVKKEVGSGEKESHHHHHKASSSSRHSPAGEKRKREEVKVETEEHAKVDGPSNPKKQKSSKKSSRKSD